ncbi:S41 family peptidase [Gilvimarinus sp. SDUM040013]|uniref:S41 family peptidase n=1 Tax=Gilvimarinus gilvus TaxID=3058038 RepID=A0ABU4RVS0_9GAMM|nr:S41 family peptidase [Gilvimarinus sp. SDUM040013]MDO3388253.1 S41 family peptidase [Gilvimarinus sp. SDUM040013]MDX6847803.1 S41 family peptidase [Gilvimarinus sp. SDUM040013]
MKVSTLAGSILTLILLAAIALIICYFLYLSPKARALKHLNFVHESIAEMHPAMLLSDSFVELRRDSYQRARKKLALINNSRDMNALLRFYLAQFEDKHLDGNLFQSIFLKWFPQQTRWAGWVLAASQHGYEVIHRLDEPHIPPLGATLVSCNGVEANEFLRRHYAPFSDLRWSILNARDSAAKRLTQSTDMLHVLDRPALNQCVFQTAKGEQSFPVEWRPRTEQDARAIHRASTPIYTRPKLEPLGDSAYWVYTTDFQLNSPESARGHQQLLVDLRNLNSAGSVVFDLRGNEGGSSSFGNEILQALIGTDNMRFIHSRYNHTSGGMDARFRASWKLYWSYDWLLQQALANQGEDSSMVAHLQKLQVRLKLALDNGEDFFWQSEWTDIDVPAAEEATPPQWQYPGNIYVVTDRYCISACLDFMDLLKQIPGVIHVGEPSDADTAYTQVAPMWHEYAKEAYSFSVPIKQWNKRLRDDNEPYSPDKEYPGNIFDTQSLQAWFLDNEFSH